MWSMAGTLRMEWRNRTLKELFVMYQACIMDSWHHTAHLKMMWAGKNPKYSALHPLWHEVNNKVVISPTDFSILDSV